MPSKPVDFLGLLSVLTAHRVDFIVIGGVAGTLQGSPLLTRDLDVVHSRSEENADRVVEALEDLEAYSRIDPVRRLRPGRSLLLSPGHQLLMTRLGPLDLIGEVGGGRGYDALLPDSIELSLREGLTIRVLDLPALIKVKEETGREKDRTHLTVLKRLLEERKRR